MIKVGEARLPDIAPLREEFRAESACQVVHDSLYERRGWCVPYLLWDGPVPVGFAGLAVAGPWKGKRTVFDFYVRPSHRALWPKLWSGFADTARPDSYELQTNLPLIPGLMSHLGGTPRVDSLVYGERHPTTLPSLGARLRQLTSEHETQACLAERAGSCDWALELDGAKAGGGSLLFHYNVPYADIAMAIDEPFRHRGLGAYLVQELQRAAHALHAIPAARTSPDNLASQRTLEKAGLVLVGRIMAGALTL